MTSIAARLAINLGGGKNSMAEYNTLMKAAWQPEVDKLYRLNFIIPWPHGVIVAMRRTLNHGARFGV